MSQPLLILIVAWLGCCSAFAQLNVSKAAFVAGVLKPAAAGGSSDACTSCTNETFEGAGYVLTGWTEAGSLVNEDYATAPAPIAGSHSLLVLNAAFDTAYSEKNFANVAEAWIRIKFIATNAVPTGLFVCSIADSGGANMAYVTIQAGKLRVTSGSATAETADTISANTQYRLWLHFQNVGGANNDVADVGFSTDDTRPVAGNKFASLTTGTGAANAQIIRLGGGDGAFAGAVGGIIFDSVSASTTGAIGNY